MVTKKMLALGRNNSVIPSVNRCLSPANESDIFWYLRKWKMPKLCFMLFAARADSFGCPGYVRIAYCTTTDHIRRSLPAFRKLVALYRGE